ncbi:MAG: prolipoprotein diacylglyceryl transferase family protein [Myxococcota bacterium]
MWPTLVKVETAVGPQPVNTYGVFIVLAFSAAFLLIHTRSARAGVNPDRLIVGYVAAAVGGMIGARLLYAFSVDWQRTLSEPLSLLSCAGFAFYGGVLGGAVGVLVFALASRLPTWKLADLAAPGVVLGLGVGRFGCFFAGCCHGAVAPIGDHPVGLFPAAFTGGQLWLSGVAPFLTAEFHGGVGRIHDIPLYPTQLWSITAGLSIAAFLAWRWTKRTFDGQIAALTLMLEPPFRIAIESFRADERGYVVSWPVSEQVAAWLPPGMSSAGDQLGTAITGITTSQGIGLAMIVSGIAIWALRRNAGISEVKPFEAGDGELLEELA